MPNSVEKTMMILRIVSDGKGEPVSLGYLCEKSGINKSTISHIVSVLHRGGYLQRVSHSLGYIIGPELHFLTRYGRYGEKIITEAKPILEYLHKKTGALAVFAVLAGDKKYIIDRYPENSIYKDTDAQILSDDLYRTVTGRVLLSNITQDKALEIYKSLGVPKSGEWKEAQSIAGFLSELSQIRCTECYYQKTENGDSVWHSFAASVGSNEKYCAALGLAVKLSKTAENAEIDEKRHTALMIKCKKELYRRLKFT